MLMMIGDLGEGRRKRYDETSYDYLECTGCLIIYSIHEILCGTDRLKNEIIKQWLVMKSFTECRICFERKEYILEEKQGSFHILDL